MTSPARVSDYESFAPFYDRFTAHPAFPAWIRRIEATARRHGLRQRSVLDLGCGTGSSFMPLVEMGYDVTGVDGSPAMLAQARRKSGPETPLHCLDLRELPVLGSFPFVSWLNDGCNCMLTPDDLTRALRGCAANLANGGLLIFDANTLATYAGFFSERHARVIGELEFVWEGRTRARPGCLAEGLLSVFDHAHSGPDPLARAEQVQRHHPHAAVTAALGRAGLQLLAYLGQEPEGELTDTPAAGQLKHLYVVTKPTQSNHERRRHAEGQAAQQAGDAGPRIHQGGLVGIGARGPAGPSAASPGPSAAC